MLVGILHDEVDDVWAIVAPLLQKAIDVSEQDFDIDDVYWDIVERNMQLWVWADKNDDIVAACVTQLINKPRKRICSIPLIGGKDMKSWILCEPAIIEWAKVNGCVQLEGYCRDGWFRILRNWRKVWTTMRRDI